MDNSTEKVTLLAVFINDVLTEVEKLNVDKTPIATMTKGYDLTNPYNHVPITIYNNLCAWVEETLGEPTIIAVGRNIGETVYQTLNENGIIQANSSPIDVIEGLIIAAASMIQDDKERGWEVVHTDNTSIQMKRTQTFNSKLQFGLLKGLVSKCASVKNVEVSYLSQVANGNEFDKYLVQWTNK